VTHRARGCLLEAVETLVLTLIIFLVIQNFVAQPYQVEQMSMENTLLPNQYVLVDKLTPRFDSYKRGDIVVFTPPGASSNSTPFIKRVIGLPGDTLDLRNGHVFINDQEINEPYVYPGQTTEPLGGQAHWVVPPDMLFVMGDHRENSSDSRVFGPVPIGNVIGRAWLRYWPLSAFEVIATPTYPDLSPLALPSAAPSGHVRVGSPQPAASAIDPPGPGPGAPFARAA
jgi:signal peptidase I